MSERWRVEWEEVHVVDDIEAETSEEAITIAQKIRKDGLDTRLEARCWFAEEVWPNEELQHPGYGVEDDEWARYEEFKQEIRDAEIEEEPHE